MIRKEDVVKDRDFKITGATSGAALNVRVVTRAVETEIAGRTDEGALKVRLKATPAGDPAANEELVNFLAEQLGVEAGKIEIVAGEANRDKILSIEGITVEEVEKKLNPDF